MKHAYPRSDIRQILGILLENERTTGCNFTPIDDPSLLRFHDQTNLPHILDVLESQGYIQQSKMRVGAIHNIRLTDAGRAFFQTEAEQRHGLWLQLRFNLLQTIIIAALTFISGLIAEHYLAIFDLIHRLLTALRSS